MNLNCGEKARKKKYPVNAFYMGPICICNGKMYMKTGSLEREELRRTRLLKESHKYEGLTPLTRVFKAN